MTEAALSAVPDVRALKTAAEHAYANCTTGSALEARLRAVRLGVLLADGGTKEATGT